MGPGLDRRAPLFLAAGLNKLAALECLIRHGADLRTTNLRTTDLRTTGPIGVTCLSVAAEKNNALVIRALVAAGAPLQERMHDGATPLHLACFNVSVEATKGVCGQEASANLHTPASSTHPTHLLTRTPHAYPSSPSHSAA